MSPFLLRASYNVVRLTRVYSGGVGDALLLLGPCPSSWRTCILGTVYSILPFEDREDEIPLEVFIQSLLCVFRTVPAMQVFYTQYFMMD